MTPLLDSPPYGERDERSLFGELVKLTRHHLVACRPYRLVWPEWHDATTIEELPWLHVGVFKHVQFKTDFEGVRHERTLKSSSTTSQQASQIFLDRESSLMQSASTLAILTDFVGSARRPLVVLDSAQSLRSRGEISARLAAALSMKTLATEIHFLLGDANDAKSVRWDALERVLDAHDDVLVYGFTWMLWLVWGRLPSTLRTKLQGKRICFVHSGGWKRLESIRVDRSQFDSHLLMGLDAGSKVVDYYGLVEQVGIIYPLCEAGYRHVPRWAAVVVRDPVTLTSQTEQAGQLQLLNVLARGAPYHSVLTEDVGRLVPGRCACGRSGPRFELLGRVPKSELRGCANV